MVIEARKHGVRFVWAYIVGGALIAISVTFPLFLLARELRLATTDGARLKAVDVPADRLCHPDCRLGRLFDVL